MEQRYELFERYISAVRKYLPWKGQDDILAELRANLEAQLEDRETELGRGLTDAEMLDWLKKLGSPMQVAGPYQPQRYLIGPTLFPMYWYVLRMALMWATALYTLVNVILLALSAEGAQSVAQALIRLPGVVMTTAAWVTGVFAALEFAVTHYPNRFPQNAWMSKGWNPSSLPPVEVASQAGNSRKSYAQAVAEVVFGYILLVWLILVPHHPFILMGPGAYYLASSPFALAPVWKEFYWLVLGLNIVQVAWNGFRLWSGSWRESLLFPRVVFKLIGLVPLGLLLAAPGHILATLKNPEIDAPRYAVTLNTVNVAVWRGLQVVCVIVVLQAAVEIVQAGIKEYRRQAARS